MGLAIAAGFLTVAVSHRAEAQAAQVYAPGSYTETQPGPTYQAAPPPPGGYPALGGYPAPQPRQGYQPPAYNPAWIPQGFGANQGLQPQASPQVGAPITYGPARSYSAGRYADWSDSDYRYRISAGDELSLRFLLNPDLNTGVQVGPDGRGVFPLISSVKVAEMTVEEANGLLSQAYSQILRRPDVQVMITTYGSSQVYVGGEVRTPGVYPIRGQLTPAQAVMMAGGLATTARLGKVAIIRQRPNGQMLMKEVDLQAYLTKGQGFGPFTILPGDLIFVPRSSIAEVDRFVDQYITGLLPLGRVLGYRDPTPRTY